MTTASIITIGDEILIGQILDTNSSAISRKLGELGIRTTRMLSISDDREAIVSAISEELANNQIVITTGGLGPTKDDITKDALAEITLARGFYTHSGQSAIIHQILGSRGLDVLDANIAQASVPDTCEVIENKLGTAPVMVFRLNSADYGGEDSPAVLYSLPGVPFEALAALPDVLSDISAHFSLDSICHKTLMTYGLAESALSEKISAWESALPEDIRLAYLPNPLTGVRLRLSVYGGDKQSQTERINAQISELKAIIGDYIYSDKDDSIQEVLGRIFKEKGLLLSAAESCTGGEISHLITTVPGSSAYYLGSVTSYAVPIKVKVLGVPQETIDKYGVVSSQTAAAMAEGVRKLTGSDYSVATTGLAGPGGGDGVNPEGTVWVGVSTPRENHTAVFHYHNDRKRNIERFAASALHFLYKIVKSELNI